MANSVFAADPRASPKNLAETVLGFKLKNAFSPRSLEPRQELRRNCVGLQDCFK